MHLLQIQPEGEEPEYQPEVHLEQSQAESGQQANEQRHGHFAANVGVDLVVGLRIDGASCASPHIGGQEPRGRPRLRGAPQQEACRRRDSNER